MTTRTWSGANGSYTDPTQWSGGVVPGSGDVALINAGTVNAANVAFTNVTLALGASAGAAGTLALTSDTFDATSVLNISDTNAFGAAPAPLLTLAGATVNNGTINFLGTTPGVQFAAGASLVNAGIISLSGASPQVQTGAGLAAGAITNNGTIQVTNPSSGYQSAIINATIAGTGTISIGSAGAVAIRQSIGSGQSVAFTGGASAASALEIDAPGAFGATVSGFVTSDRLILTSIPYTNYAYASTGASSGTLTLFNGSTVQSQVRLSGVYSQGTFTVQASPLGTGGLDNVTITTSVTNSSTGATSGSTGSGTSTVGPVYRFFDTTYGTHFFTADAGEKNTVIATRPDLVEETNGFGDVAATDSNATSVYRFFDTKFGTHFFTASSTERDAILAARPDLTYEPGSTFFEHLSQQAGDVAVYRFFDTQYGTHFYTGDAGEYAGLTTPGTSTFRANLTYEGVGFYAPAGSFA